MTQTIATWVGVVLVLIGTMHFANRERRPTTRSFFTGSDKSSTRSRTAMAVVETLLGLGLLFVGLR
jgi:hypothetical protein